MICGMSGWAEARLLRHPQIIVAPCPDTGLGFFLRNEAKKKALARVEARADEESQR